MLVVGVAPAAADGELPSRMSATDKLRLADFDKARAEAVATARTGGSPPDVAILDQVLAGETRSVREGFSPVGQWKCRTIKLGGLLPLTISPWFKCRIGEDGAGWWLEKLTGSQRLHGYFYDDTDSRLVLLAASHYADERPRRYGQEPERDEVAYAYRVGGKRMRIEFPLPRVESQFDILELSR